MLSRALSVSIILFWVAMIGLLLRKELGPADSALRQVPLGHVLRLVFHHEQPSDLHLYHDKRTIGQVRIHPQVEENGRQQVEFTGNVQLALPGMTRQRLTFTGAAEFNPAMEFQRVTLHLSFREPTVQGVHLIIDPIARRLSYETRLDQQTTARGDYPLDAETVRMWLGQQGLSGLALPSSPAAPGQPVNVRAMLSSIQMRSEKIDTFLIEVQQGGQTLLAVHLSQLGQILQARSFLGYSLAPEEVAP